MATRSASDSQVKKFAGRSAVENKPFSATFRSEAKEKIKVVGQKLRDRGFLLIFV